MSFDKLIHKVTQAENALEAHERALGADWRQLKASWREAWTPGRIVIAGLIGGLLVGRAEPERALKRLGGIGGARWMQLIGMASSLLATLQSSAAAAHADDAAEQAEATAAATGNEPAGEAPQPASTSPSERRRQPEPGWDAPPRPAEAATEVSEASRH